MATSAAVIGEAMEDRKPRVKSQWLWVVIAQAISLALLAGLAVYGTPFHLTESQTLSLGQTFSMILIALGVWGYVATRKGPLPPPVFVAMGLVAPGYTLCGGAIKTIISYFIIALGLQLIFLWRQHIYLLGPTEPPKGNETP